MFRVFLEETHRAAKQGTSYTAAISRCAYRLPPYAPPGCWHIILVLGRCQPSRCVAGSQPCLAARIVRVWQTLGRATPLQAPQSCSPIARPVTVASCSSHVWRAASTRRTRVVWGVGFDLLQVPHPLPRIDDSWTTAHHSLPQTHAATCTPPSGPLPIHTAGTAQGSRCRSRSQASPHESGESSSAVAAAVARSLHHMLYANQRRWQPLSLWPARPAERGCVTFRLGRSKFALPRGASIFCCIHHARPALLLTCVRAVT